MVKQSLKNLFKNSDCYLPKFKKDKIISCSPRKISTEKPLFESKKAFIRVVDFDEIFFS